MKLYTNQGLVGYGEVRDHASKTYALMLKSRILGENPCNIDKIFRRIKQFGHHGRQAGRCMRYRTGLVGFGRKGLRYACLSNAGRKIPGQSLYVL
jgi:L-alanine-DL-glutamate epimerase-like enolase superfamily enzyme